ncbi:hypothetical protein J4221_01935 [Candidatus Pacearchaeota archaeon]|nr:hypothetical protein [Candidatus Pacearchaeota archaeon]
MITDEDIHRRGIAKRFRYMTLTKMLSTISEETLGPKGYEVFSDFGEPVTQLSHRTNGRFCIPIDIYYCRMANGNGPRYMIYYSKEEYEEDARLLAEAIYNDSGLEFSLQKRNGKTRNGSNGNNHH